MNRNLKTISALTIIFVVTVLASFLIWSAENRKINMEKKAAEEQSKKTAEGLQQSVDESQGNAEGQFGNVYENNDYGFQVSFPNDRVDYKAIVEPGVGEGVAQVRMAFKTLQPSFEEENKVTHEKYPGYFSPFYFVIWDRKYIDDLENSCESNPSGAQCSKQILGYNSKYVMEIKFSDKTIPEDLSSWVNELRSYSSGDLVKHLKAKSSGL